MTMRTSYGLICPCGHRGAVRMSENDAPYSACWESYSLEGFDGDTFHKEGRRPAGPRSSSTFGRCARAVSDC